MPDSCCYLCRGSGSLTLGGQHIDCPECTAFPRWFDPGGMSDEEIAALWRDDGEPVG